MRFSLHKLRARTSGYAFPAIQVGFFGPSLRTQNHFHGLKTLINEQSCAHTGQRVTFLEHFKQQI